MAPAKAGDRTEPRTAWGVFGLVVLVLVGWGPTPAFRQVVGALLLIGLLALGLEALRRQAAREYADARREDSFRRLREWAPGIGRRAGRAPALAGRPSAASDARLDRLERLGRLREEGLLDAAEFQQERPRSLPKRRRPDASLNRLAIRTRAASRPLPPRPWWGDKLGDGVATFPPLTEPNDSITWS